MASLKKAVEAKCKDCTYDQAAPGTWREQVEQCRVTKCALWPVRPMTVATITLQRKTRAADSELDMDAILANLEDDEEDDAVETAPAAA
jgi:hypothetical protein